MINIKMFVSIGIAILLFGIAAIISFIKNEFFYGIVYIVISIILLNYFVFLYNKRKEQLNDNSFKDEDLEYDKTGEIDNNMIYGGEE